MAEIFDIDKARNMIYKHNSFYLKRYDPERFRQRCIQENIPEDLNPIHWVGTDETVAHDYARLLKHALEYVDMGKISYAAIERITNYFRCFCYSEKGILVDEIEKEDRLFQSMIESEFDSVGAPFSNVTREFLDIWLDIALNTERALEHYRSANESNWELISSAHMINESAVNEYLLKRLSVEENVNRIDSIIEALGDNKVTSCFGIIFDRILDQFGYDISVLFALVELAESIKGKCSIQLLKMLKAVHLSERTPRKELKTSIDVALCMLEHGEKVLADWYRGTEDPTIKYEIIHCYEHFHTKSFAQLLVEALTDSHHLENGYYPIRSIAYTYLQSEPSIKLMGWFGYNIIDTLYSTNYDTRNS